MSVEARHRQSNHRFTVNDYYRMAETGVLQPDARVELLDGEIFDRSPISPFHGSIVKQLIHHFNKLAQGRWLIAVQDPVRLDDHSEPQPDVMLLKPASDFYRTRQPGPEDVLLLIEVSDTTIELDRDKKLPAYGHAGIKEVWIINLADRTIEVYREPHFTGYASKTVLRAGEFAKPQAFPDVTVSVSDLLK